MKKLLIPIEIKLEKDLPEEGEIRLMKLKDHDNIFRLTFLKCDKAFWLKEIEYWYKEVSEEEYLKKKCTKFFYWWYNQPGNNTGQGFDEWYKKQNNL